MTIRRSLAALAGVALAVGFAGPALAVQTDTFGLTATGHRTKIVAHGGSSPYRDAVLVYNRRATPVTVHLAVVSATRGRDGVYAYGGEGAGLAAHVRLGATTVVLPAHGSQQVSVTIDRPAVVRDTTYAAVTAEAAPSRVGSVAVVARLAVFLELSPAPGGSPLTRPVWLLTLAAAAITALVAAQWIVRVRQR